MALVRCPQCGRVADGITCFACGYEWESTDAADETSNPEETQGFTPDNPPPSEESAPVVIEEPAPSRTRTPPPVAIPEAPPEAQIPAAVGEAKSGVTSDLSEVLSELNIPSGPSLGSDSLEFDLGDVADIAETPPPAPAPQPAPEPAASRPPPPPADDPLSIAFAMDGLDLDTPSSGHDVAAAPAPAPAPPPQLPDDFDVEFGDVPMGAPAVPAPADGFTSDLDDLEADLDLDFGDGDGSVADPLDDDDALADVDLNTGELDPDDLLAAMSVPDDPDELDVGLGEPPAVPDENDGIAAALEAFGAPEIPDAMRLEKEDVEEEFDPFGDKSGEGEPPAPPDLASPALTPPPIPEDDESPAPSAPSGVDFGLDALSPEDALDGLGEDFGAPAAPPSEATPPPASEPELPYKDRLLARVSELAETLESEGRFDDAALLYEVHELVKS